MKQKRLRYALLACGIVLLCALMTLFYLHQNSKNVQEVEKVTSLLEEQERIAKDLQTQVGTWEDPTIQLDPYGISPLTALVSFSSDQETEVTVTVHGIDAQSTFVHTFPKANVHHLPIYGLYADQINEVTLQSSLGTQTLTIATNPLPEDFILPSKVVANKEALGNELYFFTPSSNGYTSAYDNNGDVRWYLTIDALWKIDRLKNGNLLVSSDRSLNPPYYMSGLYEMNLLGKIAVEYKLPGGYHHDYFEMENGNLLVASDNFAQDNGTVEDLIVEMDRESGEIVKTIDLQTILPKSDGKSENWSEHDWFHNNAVWYDQPSNTILLSGRHQDAVVGIDYDTSALKWIIGDPQGWSEAYQKYFFSPIGEAFEWQWSQHAAMTLPNGDIFLFDNGNNRSKNKEEYIDASENYSRGVVYRIDTEKMTIQQVYEYGKERGSAFYSPYISDVDHIEENHIIVHSGGIVYQDGKNANQPAGLIDADALYSDTVEIKDGNVIFEMILPTNLYRVEKMAMYEEESVSLFEPAQVKGSFMETIPSEEGFDFFTHAQKIDESYTKNKITWTKEYDRLILHGEFEKGTTASIYLYQNMQYKKYDLRISKTPYTALCIVVDEENDSDAIVVDYSINEEGIQGEYAIYLELNGVLYDTEKKVQFIK